jgi:hypothetical protein
MFSKCLKNPFSAVRSHPTLEQLESLPVIRCMNGSAAAPAPEVLPTPPENEDDHIESNNDEQVRILGSI